MPYKTSENLKRLFRVLKRADDGSEITLPDAVVTTIQPTLDLANWSPYRDVQYFSGSAVGPISLFDGPATPENTMRFVSHYSVLDVRAVGVIRTVWLSKVVSAVEFGLTPPSDLPASALTGEAGFTKPVILLPGELLRARVEPVNLLADSLGIRIAFIDFPIDEANPIPTL